MTILILGTSQVIARGNPIVMLILYRGNSLSGDVFQAAKADERDCGCATNLEENGITRISR